jgi:hypothetical protein
LETIFTDFWKWPIKTSISKFIESKEKEEKNID